METPVIRFKKDGTFVSEHESLIDAQKMCNVNAGNISAVCNGRRKRAGGYVWKFAADVLSDNQPTEKQIKKLNSFGMICCPGCRNLYAEHQTSCPKCYMVSDVTLVQSRLNTSLKSKITLSHSEELDSKNFSRF